MEPLVDAEVEEITRLSECVKQGGGEAVGALLERHRARLRRAILLRMDRRVQARIDPSDVIQDAFVEVVRRMDAYLKEPRMPLYLWLRFIVSQKLLQLHRYHLGAEIRDAERELSLHRGVLSGSTSAILADELVSRGASPESAAQCNELKTRLQQALDIMDPRDREIVALRHFEGLTNREVARLVGIREAAASQRYVRALERLKKVFEALGHGGDLAR